MEITRGKLIRPQRVVVYGVEGIGKSTFAASFPNPLFIDTEGSTGQLDVARTPAPSSWAMLKGIIADLQRDRMEFQTLVIDTADWAERLCIDSICKSNGIASLGGGNDYGRSYNLLCNEWGSFLDSLSELTGIGLNVVLTAHAKITKFELPEESGAYDRYELKLEKKTSALLKEWPDMVLFANYKTHVIKDDKTKKTKAAGSLRVMHTVHHACWDAKNRHELPNELAFEFAKIAHCIPVAQNPAPAAPPTQATTPQSVAPQSNVQEVPPAQSNPAPTQNTQPAANEPAHLKKLRDLMGPAKITEEDIIGAVAAGGHFPASTPFSNLPADYVEGRLIANWDKVCSYIATQKQEAQKATA